jgi:hypothetical protein
MDLAHKKIMNTRDVGPFAVLNFALDEGDDGRPIQRTASCGTFVEVERAFAVARERAEEELGQLRERARSAPAVIELLDTEWGYDVRQNYLVVSRYWVHDRAPSALMS